MNTDHKVTSTIVYFSVENYTRKDAKDGFAKLFLTQPSLKLTRPISSLTKYMPYQTMSVMTKSIEINHKSSRK